MKVRLLSLNVDKNMPFSHFKARVISSIKMYSNGLPSFEVFENMRDLFGALQDALENDELILTAVDTKHYIKLKETLIGALETEVQYNPAVLNLLEKNEEMDDETRKDFSVFPEPATVFLSNDGLYSGFGIENGSQYMIFVPVDNERIDNILRNGVVPFLSKHTGIPQNTAEQQRDSKDTEKVKLAVKRLIEGGSVAAVNGTKNAEVIKSCGDCVEGFDDVFIFTPHVEDKGEVNATEYSAQLAKVSLDLSSANIGAAISDIYSAGETKYICIAVANDDSAVVRKLYMSDNESEAAFVESAAMELIELIGEKATGLRSVGIEITDGGDTIDEDVKKPAGKKSMIILSCVLGAIIVICAVLGIVYKIQGENGAVAKALRSVFGNKETLTVTDAITKPSDLTTQPIQTPPQTSTIKLSEFMAADLIELEKHKIEESLTNPETPENPDGGAESETEVAQDSGAPKTMKINGTVLDAKEAVARLVMVEMGEGYNTEAIKAQAVVIYTYLKYRDNGFEINGVTLSDTYNNEVMDAVEAVYGEYLSYNGEVALTPYFASAARKTADAATVFSNAYPYLTAVTVQGNPDSNDGTYTAEQTISVDAMRDILLAYNRTLTLSENPAEWISIDKHDAALSSSIGYVTKISFGGITMSGFEFKTNVMPSILKSHCFTINFDAENNTFTVTSYGSGICVGMSQAGANYLAGNGSDYKTILSTYYKKADLVKEENI